MRRLTAIVLLPLLLAAARPALELFGAAVPVLVLFGAAKPALAGQRGPACREPSVIDEITREVRERNYYSRISPRLVTETPTADPRVVRCQVCVEQAPYTPTRSGDRPVRQCVPHDFAVRILPNGFVVSDLR